MSGENESKTVTLAERRAKIERLINEYTQKMTLGNLNQVNEVEQYLNADPLLLKNMSAEECGIASVVIARAATYIQLQVNKIRADIRWCDKYINYLIAAHISNVGSKYTPYDYKRCLAIMNNDVARELDSIIKTAEVRLDTMEFIPQYLKSEAQMFAELQQTKKGQRA